MSAHEHEAGASGDRPATEQERALIESLRRGDEGAFTALVDRYHGPMVRLAMAFVPNRAAAEDVAQEAWLGVLRGIARFEGRSSLRTWIFRILTNRAKTRGVREGRMIPFSDLWSFDDEPDEPALAPERFQGPQDAMPGHWFLSPRAWDAMPEERFLSNELRAVIDTAINTLPASQRAVITMRDLEGWPSQEVCNILGVSETNQRVLLHRARARVRRALETYFTYDQAGV